MKRAFAAGVTAFAAAALSLLAIVPAQADYQDYICRGGSSYPQRNGVVDGNHLKLDACFVRRGSTRFTARVVGMTGFVEPQSGVTFDYQIRLTLFRVVSNSNGTRSLYQVLQETDPEVHSDRHAFTAPLTVQGGQDYLVSIGYRHNGTWYDDIESGIVTI